jgi:hypothetical protein
MPPRAFGGAATLSSAERDARKKYLVLACACDRVELALAWKRPAQASGPLGVLMSNPWVQTATTLITPWLPRKLRVANLLFRLWKSRD